MSFDLQEWLLRLASLKKNLPLHIDDVDFNALVIVKYHQWVIEQLECLFKRSELTQDDIKAFFIKHWDLVKFSQLSPTAMPQSDVVLFLCQLAQSISSDDCRPLEIFMPGLMWLSLREPYPNLDEHVDLASILKNHVLSDDGKTLIPIALFNEEDILNHSFQDNRTTIYNPYFEQADYQYQKISASEFKRLCLHSSQTDGLHQAIIDFSNLVKDKTDLHSHLLALCHHLRFNDAHVGIGREEKVGEGVFVGLVAFSQYFNELCASEKEKIPAGLLEAISHLLMVSSEPMVQALANFSLNDFQCLSKLLASNLYKEATEQNYSSIRFTGAEIRQLEKALGQQHALIEKIKPLNMVNLIYTCAGIRREEIETQMQGHEKLLMNIGLNAHVLNQQKQAIFEKIQSLLKGLNEDLQSNRYTGIDQKSLTIQLIKVLNLKSCLEIKNPHQLKIFKHMQPEEIDLVLLELPYLKKHIINQFSENWSWISFFHDLSEFQLDVILKHISDFMRWRSIQFYEALFSLQPEKHKIILKYFLYLFAYDEFKRIQPLDLNVLVKSVLELSAEHIIKFLKIPPMLELISTDVYLDILIEKIKLDPRVLQLDDSYKILGNLKICEALINCIEPEILSELAGRYVDLGIHIKRQSFILLINYLLSLPEKKYLLNLVSVINYDELLILMKAFKKEFIPHFLDGLSKIRCPSCLIPMIRATHHLKPGDIQKYQLQRLLTMMAENIEIDSLSHMESNDFYLLFVKVPTIPAISLLFSRVDGQKKLTSLFKHVISLHYVYSNLESMHPHQVQIVTCLIENLVMNLQHLTPLERKDIFSHRMTYRLFQKFAPDRLKNVFQFLSIDELRQVIRKESNAFWKELSGLLIDYLGLIDDQLLVDILALNTTNGSRIIDILPPLPLQDLLVPRIQKNESIVLNDWWVLERAGIATQLPYLIGKQHLSVLMDRVFSNRSSYPNLMLGILHCLSLLNLDDDSLLLDLLLMKKTYNTFTWAQYFFENFKEFETPLDLLKFRLSFVCNWQCFGQLLQLNCLVPLNDSGILIKLAPLGESRIYDGFEFADFQNLIDFCVREPHLSTQLPLMTQAHLKVFTSAQFKIHFDANNTLPLSSQDKLFKQVACYLFEQYQVLSSDEDKSLFLKDKFFDSDFAIWMKLHKPIEMNQMLKALSFEQWVNQLKKIKYKHYFKDFLPYLWQLFPNTAVEGLQALDGPNAILEFINMDVTGCMAILMEKYPLQQNKILKLLANLIEDKDIYMSFGHYFNAGYVSFYANLLKDLKLDRHFLKLLMVLLKHNRFEILIEHQLLKHVIVERFMRMSYENADSFKGFFHHHYTDSDFDFNRWMSLLPTDKREQFVANLRFSPDNFLVMNAVLPVANNPRSINYLIYTAQCYPELVVPILKKFLAPAMRCHSLIRNYILRDNLLYLFHLEPESAPIILDFMFEFNQSEFNQLIHDVWLRDEMFVLNLLKCHPCHIEKIINLAPYENLKILKETTKGFVLFSRVEHVLHHHQVLLALLFNQLTSYSSRMDYFQQLKSYRRHLEQNQPLLACLTSQFTKTIFENLLKKQLSECVGLIISRVHYHHFSIRDKLIGFVGDRLVSDSIDDIIAELNVELLNVTRNLNLLKFKKSLSFFNSAEHEKLEIQTIFLETQNLLVSYRQYLETSPCAPSLAL